MSSAVHDLQMAIVEGKQPLTQLLRLAKVIAAKLNLEAFEQWVDLELNGYPEGAELPNYRSVESYSIQVLNQSAELEFSAPHEVRIDGRQPFSELQALSLKGDNYFPWNASGQRGAMYLVVDGSEFKRITDAVANRLLDWALKLEKLGVKGEDMNFGEKEKQSAGNMVFNNFGTIQGNVGNVTNSQVNLNDSSSIHQLLVNHGVPTQARHELEEIMEELKTAPPEKKPSIKARAGQWVVKHKDLLGTGAEVVGKAIKAVLEHATKH
jgi:hypothetical protein